MNVLSEDNVVVRTLLNVLDPSAEQLDACAKKKYSALKKLRISLPPPVLTNHEQWQRPTAQPARFVIQERLSSCTISVSWSDPCSGRYNEQVWRTGLARTAATCVLSGRSIRRGDQVFRPRSSDAHMPVNEQQMILVATVESLTSLPVGSGFPCAA